MTLADLPTCPRCGWKPYYAWQDKNGCPGPGCAATRVLGLAFLGTTLDRRHGVAVTAAITRRSQFLNNQVVVRRPGDAEAGTTKKGPYQ